MGALRSGHHLGSKGQGRFVTPGRAVWGPRDPDGPRNPKDPRGSQGPRDPRCPREPGGPMAHGPQGPWVRRGTPRSQGAQEAQEPREGDSRATWRPKILIFQLFFIRKWLGTMGGPPPPLALKDTARTPSAKLFWGTIKKTQQNILRRNCMKYCFNGSQGGGRP